MRNLTHLAPPLSSGWYDCQHIYKSSDRIPAMKRTFAALALFALLAACGGEDPTQRTVDQADAPETTACERAWEAASKVPDGQDTHEDLHPAFTACSSFDEWRNASREYPSVLDGIDPETYARNQCEYTPELGQTLVCGSLPG
jgi:hypothetical protein